MWVYGIIGLVGLLSILMVTGLPIGIAMVLIGFLGLAVLSSPLSALQYLGVHFASVLTSYDMAMVATFVLMGEIARVAGLGRAAYDFLNRILGRIPGGLGLATVAGSAVFGAVCGSAPATAATIGSVAIPEMRRHGYPPELTASNVVAGGTLGILIPPSLGFILYAMLTGESLAKLYLAGIVPGILATAFYCLCTFVLSLKLRIPTTSTISSPREILLDFLKLLPIFAIFLLVIGGLAKGFFTPTVAGAVGSGLVFVYGLAKKELNWSRLSEAAENAVLTTGFIILIYAGALLFNYFVAGTGLTFWLTECIRSAAISPKLVVLIILAVWFVLGWAMDEVGMMILTLPLFYPIVKQLGVDGIWFAVLAVRSIEVGIVTPPIGMNIFVVQGLLPEVELGKLYKTLLWFVLADLACICVLFFIPEISLLLPGLMG